MRETVTICVGQCGNQIGNNFWNQLLLEHEKTPDTDESLSAFFRFVPQKDGRTHAMKARALLIDMECGPLQETMRSPLGALFDETQFVYDVSGSGNNFAQGHYFYGPKYRSKLEEGLRRNAESCDSLQTFLVTHSLGGGTGSGVGTYMLGLLADEYPKICRFSTCVYPSEDNDVVTSPYNVLETCTVMLATKELIEHADCVFPLDNSALFAFSQREKLGKSGMIKDEGNSSSNPINPAKRLDKGFNAINSIAARMLCHLTSSSRFNGEMNVDLNEIYTNLIPFPRLHFLVTALNIQQQTFGCNVPANHRTNSTVHGTRASMNTSGRHGARASLQRAFNDVLSEKGQLAAAFPVQIPQSSSLGGQRGGGSICLSSAFLARGNSDSVPLSDFLDCVTTAQKNLRFPDWNQNACKIGMCSTPTPGENMSILAVYNSTSFGAVLTRELKGFQRLFRKKAMLHHYTEFVDRIENDYIIYIVKLLVDDLNNLYLHLYYNINKESEIAQAEYSTIALLNEYETLERSGSIADCRMKTLNIFDQNINSNNVQLFPAF